MEEVSSSSTSGLTGSGVNRSKRLSSTVSPRLNSEKLSDSGSCDRPMGDDGQDMMEIRWRCLLISLETNTF